MGSIFSACDEYAYLFILVQQRHSLLDFEFCSHDPWLTASSIFCLGVCSYFPLSLCLYHAFFFSLHCAFPLVCFLFFLCFVCFTICLLAATVSPVCSPRSLFLFLHPMAAGPMFIFCVSDVSDLLVTVSNWINVACINTSGIVWVAAQPGQCYVNIA